MEQRMAAANPRKSRKEGKNNKKKQPPKVVYITNPIKFTATASEFRALVQELTGQDADVPDISHFSPADGGGATAGAAEEEGGVQAKSNPEVGGAAAGEKTASTTDPSTLESYENYGSCGPEIVENFLGLESYRLWHDEDVHVDDVFQRL